MDPTHGPLAGLIHTSTWVISHHHEAGWLNCAFNTCLCLIWHQIWYPRNNKFNPRENREKKISTITLPSL